MESKCDNEAGLKLINKTKLMYIKEIIDELKNDPELTLYLASEEDWNKLVCEKLLEMYRIHAAVISTHEDLPSYIGNATAIAPNVNLPECRTTWTCFTGEVFLQNGFGSPKTEI